MRTTGSPTRSVVTAAVLSLAAAVMLAVAATTAAAQTPKPLGTDLITGKAGEHGHQGEVAMHLGNGLGGFTTNRINMGGFTGYEVAAGDLNNDGKEDLVVVSHNGLVYVGLGSFLDGLQTSDLASSSTFVEAPGNCCERTRVTRLADVNNDGNLDIVVTQWSKMAVKLGNGDGTFGASIVSNATGVDARGMDLGDLDGDGKLDLVANHAPGAWWLAFHKGNGNGTFQPGVVIPNSAIAVPNMAIRDADGDGDLDVITGSFDSTFKVFVNNGSASFTRVNVGTGSGILQVTYDFNGDGEEDVVTGTGTALTVTLTNGSGGYLAPASVGPISLNPRHGAVGDFNKDGKADLAIVAVEIFGGAPHDGELWIIPGNGNGTFQPPTHIPTSSYRNNYTIAVANFKKPSDTTPPVITPTVTGLQSGGWYTSNVTISWTVADPESAFTSTGCATQSVTSDTSGTTFTCSATSEGGTSTQSVTVKRDTTGPAIASVTADTSILWPANNKMRAITLSVSATDAGAGMAGCKITAVNSNEGGSAHEPDVELTGPLTMNLRAEREGKGSGRVYTAVVTCTDAAGNASTSSTVIAVPHDQGKR